VAYAQLGTIVIIANIGIKVATQPVALSNIGFQ